MKSSAICSGRLRSLSKPRCRTGPKRVRDLLLLPKPLLSGNALPLRQRLTANGQRIGPRRSALVLARHSTQRCLGVFVVKSAKELDEVIFHDGFRLEVLSGKRGFVLYAAR